MTAIRADVEKEARRILAAYYSGHSVQNDAIEWGALALAAGIDEPNVRMLAASGRLRSWFETEPYFRAALAEAEVPWLSRERVLRAVALDIAADILRGEVDPKSGARQIERVAIELDYPRDLMEFYSLDDDLNIEYGGGRVSSETWKQRARSAARKLLDSSQRHS